MPSILMSYDNQELTDVINFSMKDGIENDLIFVISFETIVWAQNLMRKNILYYCENIGIFS